MFPQNQLLARSYAMHLRTFLCALFLLSFAACDKAAETPTAEEKSTELTPVVIATVGDTTFSEQDIDREFDNLPERFQNMKDNDGMRANILSGIMTRTALTNKAKVLGVAEQPVVRAQIMQAEASILIQALHKDYQKELKTVSDEDIQNYFDNNKQRFNKGEQIRVRHILVKEEEKAKNLFQQLKDGADFSQLAKENSIDPGTKGSGGELPPFSQGAMAPPFEQAAFALKGKDDISDIVQTRFGFHIIQLIEKIAAQETKLESVKAQIKNEIGQKSFQGWVETVKAENVFSVASERYQQHIKVPEVETKKNEESTK